MQIIQFLRDYSIVVMFVTFVLILVLTFWPGRKPRFERDGQIPLQDDR
jgi:cbb3-type cytochrome oxidase subunit 3